MNRNMSKIGIVLFLSFQVLACFSQSDTLMLKKDSLSLDEVLKTVLQKYPAVKQAEKAIELAGLEIKMAKSLYYPTADFSASYAHLGPVPTIDFPGMGQFQLAPNDNVNTTVNVHETLWDFGFTSKKIELATKSKKISEESMELVKQHLTLAVINVFYGLVYLQEAIVITEEQIDNLNSHLEFVQKKIQTGSATDFEILSTKVKLANAESQKTDLEALRIAQLAGLNAFLGLDSSTELRVKKDVETEFPLFLSDSLVTTALTNREEIILANIKLNLFDLQYELEKASGNPVLSFMASAGFKNGYVPNLDELKANYVVGLGLQIPLYDANRKKYRMEEVLLKKESNQYKLQLAKINITNEVISSNAQVAASAKKIAQAQAQFELAQRALQMARVNYQEGVITNLELIDASNNFSQSELLLLKANIDYVVNIYKLKLSMGLSVG